MRDESIKIPILFTLLLVFFLLISLSSAPLKQFVEGEFASSTIPLMEIVISEEQIVASSTPEQEVVNIITLENEEIPATTTQQATGEEIPSTIEILVDNTDPVATSNEEKEANEDGASSASKLISTAVIFEPEPIEVLIQKEEYTEELVYVDDLIDRFVIDKPDFSDFKKCQTNKLSPKYKNPGECIRAMR